MSTSAGPNIVEDGLVLALDAANEKSFRGEPTTNEVIATTWSGDGGPTISSITDPSLMYKNYVTHSIIGGTSGNCYLHVVGTDLSSTTSTQWTFSCYVRRADRAPITSMNVYMYYPSSDGSAAATIQDVGDGWYRLYRSRTGTAATITLAGFTGLTSGVKYYMSGPQLETKTYPTPFAGINTTRGSTVATGGGWADLSGNGNDGEFINSPSESNGALVFNRTNYVNVLDGASLDIVGDKTISGWVYLPSIASCGFMGKSNNSVRGMALGYGWNSNGFMALAWNSSNNPYLAQNASRDLSKWIYLSAVQSGGTRYIYRMDADGIESSSFAGGTHSWNNSANLTIGSANGASNLPPSGTKISHVTVHNRALSQGEIYETFNALRGRYGI